MGNTIAGVEQDEVVLSVECVEPKGAIVRHVRRCYLSFEKLRTLYDRLGQFEVLFNNQHGGDFKAFVSNFVAQTGPDTFEPTGLFWEVDDVGILYLTNIKPGYEATAHFSFWDRRYRGREELLKEMIRYNFEKLQLHRLVAEVPLFAPALLSFTEKLGFVKEGRRRQTTWYKNQWFDSNIYSILRSEVF